MNKEQLIARTLAGENVRLCNVIAEVADTVEQRDKTTGQVRQAAVVRVTVVFGKETFDISEWQPRDVDAAAFVAAYKPKYSRFETVVVRLMSDPVKSQWGTRATGVIEKFDLVWTPVEAALNPAKAKAV